MALVCVVCVGGSTDDMMFHMEIPSLPAEQTTTSGGASPNRSAATTPGNTMATTPGNISVKGSKLAIGV